MFHTLSMNRINENFYFVLSISVAIILTWIFLGKSVEIP